MLGGILAKINLLILSQIEYIHSDNLRNNIREIKINHNITKLKFQYKKYFK